MSELKLGPILIRNRFLISIYNFLENRLGIKEILDLEVFYKLAPSYLGIFSCFGGITFFIFILQVVTGILLLVYYVPTTAQAYDSVVYITNDVPFGWLIRGLHHWGANIMIVTVFIHMGKIYFHGIYKNPRELNWVTGIVLLVCTLSFSFTGYLLPWTQLSYWATVVGTEIPSALPVAGEYIKIFLRGGADVSQVTLTRFFAVHIMVLPAAVVMFVILHLLMIRRQGISGPL
jgi:quinol-cytochrome oxidoreductase complex cytochrome b subunit